MRTSVPWRSLSMGGLSGRTPGRARTFRMYAVTTPRRVGALGGGGGGGGGGAVPVNSTPFRLDGWSMTTELEGIQSLPPVRYHRCPPTTVSSWIEIYVPGARMRETLPPPGDTYVRV